MLLFGLALSVPAFGQSLFELADNLNACMAPAAQEYLAGHITTEMYTHACQNELQAYENFGKSPVVVPNSETPITKNTQASGYSAGTCAPNGSCYGDLNANGVPKTVDVQGYYRKDGTHVQGYYRSAPGSNPKVK